MDENNNVVSVGDEKNNNNVVSEGDKKKNNNVVSEDNSKSLIISFINKNIKMLCDIYLKHYKIDGFGTLYFRMNSETTNVDVLYLKWSDIHIDSQKNILERKKENSDNIIYFIILDNEEKETIIEIDIRDFFSK